MKQTWQILNVLSLVFALALNYLVAGQVLGLPAINEVSDRYASLLTPATYAFSIWSIIYLFLIIFVIYQARDLFKPQKKNDLPMKVGPWFVIASICNGLWTLVYANDLIWLSVLLLISLTISLYILIAKLDIAIYDAKPAVIIAVWWPLLFYTGWVTVATVVNITNWLVSVGVILSPVLACVILVVLGAGLLAILALRNVRELLITATWGIIAVGVQQTAAQGESSVATTAFTVSGVLLVAVLLHGYANRKSSPFASFGR